ncbi:PD-(D/E)XK motif protein [Pseudomonas syringae group sp. 26L6]|uniref:PD-(D/E)XK motif protein n=1 Tax=Pseudomonas syringae group sp. 26L6 TaxID=3079591 RepID=UPI002907A07F|nr:PD-(D/E)XK motif protein [Pseudomonas syringae group sp. 26L6]MDU8643716.1 PD-(D/E)XK motif protein [Pseudomonas syringae group sp. 26L6]
MMFKDLWIDLHASALNKIGPGTAKRLIGLNAICPMFIGVRAPGMLRTFILEVPRDSAPLPEIIPASRGLYFTVQITGDEILSNHASLILFSSAVGYNDIFASIADDIYSKLHALTKQREVIAGFLSRVRLWQAFFEKQGDDGLSEEAQRGLYGELRFLKNHAFGSAHNLEKAVISWTGPRSRQHDFQFGHAAVEIKTSASKQHQKLQITSEQQLDETTVGKLYLYYISVALIERGSDTLPSLVDDIRARLSLHTGALSEFNNLLIAAGYIDSHRSKYDSTGYATRESAVFLVEKDFPRIRENEIRAGVGDVKYSISVAQCKNYEIPLSELALLIKEAC